MLEKIDFEFSDPCNDEEARALPLLLIATTIPDTFATILKNQPRYLANHIRVALATSPGERLQQVAQNENLPVYIVPMRRGISIWNDLISVFRMVRVLHVMKPDLVHSYTPKAGLVTMLAAYLCRVPVRIHTFTGLIFPTSFGIKKRILIWIDRLICACATHVVPEGIGVKNDLRGFHITRKPLNVIGYGNIAGVDTSYFSPSVSEVQQNTIQLISDLSIQPNDFLFCFIGRLNKDKGLTELVGAFKALPETARLLLVGGIDESAPVDAETLHAIRSHPRIHQLGFCADIRPALLASDVLVLPSYREGFPNVVLQAGAMELPVIATNINGCNEIIEIGINGWLVPPRDIQALEKAMSLAMHFSTEGLNEMGKQARLRIQQRFEQKQHWERMGDFYCSLLRPH